MKTMDIAKLEAGMIIGKNVYSVQGQIIAEKGTILDDRVIMRLEFYSVTMVEVEEASETSNQELSEKEHSYTERLKSHPEYVRFKEQYGIAFEEFTQKINDIVEQNRITDIETIFSPSMQKILMGPNTFPVFDLLANMHNYDDATYSHSMNVALITNLLAGWLNFSKEEIYLATLCGLFHDIGKLLISDTLIKKPGSLTAEEYRMVQGHCREGYELLRASNVDEHIQNAALMHHERCDGTGYPFGLKGDKIDPYAKLVSIADVYDAMTSARVYRGPLCPFKAIEIFEQEGLQKYEVKYVQCFLEHVVNTYLLTSVRLNDGRCGEVIYVNKSALARPVVRCRDQFIDLSKERNLCIEEII